MRESISNKAIILFRIFLRKCPPSNKMSALLKTNSPYSYANN